MEVGRYTELYYVEHLGLKMFTMVLRLVTRILYGIIYFACEIVLFIRIEFTTTEPSLRPLKNPAYAFINDEGRLGCWFF